MSANGFEGLAEGPTTDDLKQLSTLATQMWEAERELEKAEADVKSKKENLASIQERDIPELMAKCGMKEFTTKTGLKVKVSELVRAAIPKDNILKAVQWLDEHEHGGLVKRSVVVPFPREKEAEAKALFKRLQGAFPDATEELSVHPSTLSSFVRQELAEGHEIPMQLFGASQFQRANLTNTKKSKFTDTPAVAG